MGCPAPGMKSPVAQAVEDAKRKALLEAERAESFRKHLPATILAYSDLSSLHRNYAHCGGCGALGENGGTCEYCGQVIYFSNN